MKKPTWAIPAILVTGLAASVALGGLTHSASAEDGDGRGGHGHMRSEAPGDYGWSGQRWREDDRRGDDDRGPRWRDRDDDRRGYGRRGGDDDDCGPRGRGRGYGHHGRGWDDRGGHGGGHGMHHGYGRGREGMGRGYDRRDDSDRGYGRGWGHGRHGGMGRGGMFDPAAVDSIKRELNITAQQEAAWTKYAGAVKEAADAMKTRREAMRAGAARDLSVEDHRKFRDSMMEQRRKEIDAVRTAADELVKSLDEKQAAIAREVLPGYAFGPGMRGAGTGWGGGRNR